MKKINKNDSMKLKGRFQTCDGVSGFCRSMGPGHPVQLEYSRRTVTWGMQSVHCSWCTSVGKTFEQAIYSCPLVWDQSTVPFLNRIIKLLFGLLNCSPKPLLTGVQGSTLHVLCNAFEMVIKSSLSQTPAHHSASCTMLWSLSLDFALSRGLS